MNFRKLFAIAAIACATLHAQVTVSVTGPATARPGATITLNVNAAGTTNTGAAAMQWQLGNPAGFSETVADGPTATAAAKSHTCAAAATSNFCVVYGLTSAVIGNGVVATYSVTIPATAASGSVSFPLSGVVAANATGTTGLNSVSVPVTLGSPYTLSVLSKTDINGDGKTDVSDLQILVTEIVAAQSTPSACVDDQNGDGKCDVLDIVIIVLKILAGG